jgi:L-threonylcarbamoyladenylate synthase
MRALKRTVIYRVDPSDPDPEAIRSGAEAIKKGLLVAFPTETVYGIAANMLDRKAIGRLYEVKRRFRGKPFTVHIADKLAIRAMGCSITRKASALIGKFWPGPLTVILRSKDGASVGFRMPANRVALDLIRASGVPVAAPSANISGKRPPVDAKGVLRDLDGKVDILIDSGRTEVGVESTVVDLTVDPPAVLREGAISKRALVKVLLRK